MNTMRIVYHYCARYADPDTGAVTHLDGILSTNSPIADMDTYHAAKMAIDGDNADRLTILTLTPLPDEVRGEPH